MGARTVTYRCPDGHTVELTVPRTDTAPDTTDCIWHDQPCKRVWHPVGMQTASVPGFHAHDYRSRR